MQKGARVRAAHVVTRIDPDNVDGDDMLRWHCHKINGAPPQRDFAIRRKQDETTARLTACDLPKKGNAPKAEKVLETALRLVQAAGDDGIPRTDLIKEVIAMTQVGKRTIEEVVSTEVRPHPNVLEYAIPGRGNPKGYKWPPAAPEDKLEGIRESLERLERTQLVEPETAAQVAQLDKLEAAARETAETSKHGPVVRLALWLEGLLQR